MGKSGSGEGTLAPPIRVHLLFRGLIVKLAFLDNPTAESASVNEFNVIKSIRLSVSILIA